MPLPSAAALQLSDSERRQLIAISRQRMTPRGIALRINIILGAAEGIANRVLARRLATSVPTVLLWRKRYASGSVATMKSRASEMETISHLSSGEAEHGRNEAELPLDFTLADPFCLSLPNHVHCLVTSDRSPGTPK
jgi:hypothetical protein